MVISPDTKISNKKYDTIGNLLNGPVKTIIMISIHEKDPEIRQYLFDWLYTNYYSVKPMSGSLTNRVRIISNKVCFNYIISNIFNNSNLFENSVTTEILNVNYLNFIRLMNNIDASVTGIFIDYLMRRILCEMVNREFSDSRAKHNCDYNIYKMYIEHDDEFIFDRLNIYIKDCLLRVTDKKYKTKNILIDILIVSLSHKMAFSENINQKHINDLIMLIKNTHDILNIFYNPLHELCVFILKDNKCLMLNPDLSGRIKIINKILPADCDLVINDNLYDFKCTSRNNTIYDILQLLGYAALLRCVPEFNKKINSVFILNLLQGFMIKYDISNVSEQQMLSYLRLLTK
jgi:hypothetical protein